MSTLGPRRATESEYASERNAMANGNPPFAKFDTVSGGTFSNAPGSTAVPPRQPPPPRTVANIVVFGETGVGKSALIKMLREFETTQPQVSGDARGCTMQTAEYLITIGNAKEAEYYCVWDTPGLNEGREGTIAAMEALLKIHTLVQTLIREGKSVDLLVYCIRASRFRNVLRVNYDLVAKTICKNTVPAVIVVTGLENEENMDGWWKANQVYFKDMEFKGHACVTTTRGKQIGNNFVFEREYRESQKLVQDLIQKSTTRSTPLLTDDANIEKDIRNYMADYNSRVEKGRGLLGLFTRLLGHIWY